jgi:sugar phosphate isomerase/epimerase
MKIGGALPAHLTYCTNIHPGETWAEVRHNLEAHVVRVRALVAPNAPFGVGLRLSGTAARELQAPGALDELRAFLTDHDLYVFTINGFPYGPFHGTPVKEQVYRPDWQEDERLAYTNALAGILAALLPDGMPGSVSTVPGCFRPRAAAFADREAMADRLLRHAAELVRIERATGKHLALALEPEPRCVIETTEEAIAFFGAHLLSAPARKRLAALTGMGESEAEAALRSHLGVCFDACHAAVEFESPQASVDLLKAKGIAIPKVQVSAGLRVFPVNEETRAALRAFAEDVYLHQVVARGADGTMRRYTDLADALGDDAGARDAEWRVHFHVPLFREQLGAFTNTQGFLRDLLRLQARAGVSAHLEVETYTWGVLPSEFRGADVAEDVAREMRWAMDALAP